MTVDPTAMFDIQIKRIHEYKRQLMNILRGRGPGQRDPPQTPEKALIAPRVKIFGGKAAPAYTPWPSTSSG